MGRRKLEMKQIEDKSSKQLTFSKRRSCLFKKARHLSILCDVDVAVVVISTHGKLYEFSSDGSGGSNNRYQKSCLEAEEKLTDKDLEFQLQCKRFRTCKELLQTADGKQKQAPTKPITGIWKRCRRRSGRRQRRLEENNTEELSVTDMMQLELELNDALVQTRLRKTQLMREHLSTLQEEQRKLREGNEEMEKQAS